MDVIEFNGPGISLQNFAHTQNDLSVTLVYLSDLSAMAQNWRLTYRRKKNAIVYFVTIRLHGTLLISFIAWLQRRGLHPP